MKNGARLAYLYFNLNFNQNTSNTVDSVLVLIMILRLWASTKPFHWGGKKDCIDNLLQIEGLNYTPIPFNLTGSIRHSELCRTPLLPQLIWLFFPLSYTQKGCEYFMIHSEDAISHIVNRKYFQAFLHLHFFLMISQNFCVCKTWKKMYKVYGPTAFFSCEFTLFVF